jgi:S-adenosylmethionine hydrolase
MMPAKPLITLTTDFGERDYFVGAMKGVILSINPDAQIIDLSHQIKPHDVLEGAFLISQAYRFYPAQTVHCVVVDPGVGTSRRPLIVSANNYYFVAPDNGVLSLIYDQAENIEAIHAITTHYFRGEISQTFHGRDIFAPLAAWLTRGIPLSNFGDQISDLVRFRLPQVRVDGDRQLKGAVIKIDRFGNCITNITPSHLPGFFATQRPPFKFRVGSTVIQKIGDAYADVESTSPFIIVGSSDFLEIAVNRASAADALKIARGAEVEVTW